MPSEHRSRTGRPAQSGACEAGSAALASPGRNPSRESGPKRARRGRADEAQAPASRALAAPRLSPPRPIHRPRRGRAARCDEPTIDPSRDRLLHRRIEPRRPLRPSPSESMASAPSPPSHAPTPSAPSTQPDRGPPPQPPRRASTARLRAALGPQLAPGNPAALRRRWQERASSLGKPLFAEPHRGSQPRASTLGDRPSPNRPGPNETAGCPPANARNGSRGEPGGRAPGGGNERAPFRTGTLAPSPKAAGIHCRG